MYRERDICISMYIYIYIYIYIYKVCVLSRLREQGKAGSTPETYLSRRASGCADAGGKEACSANILRASPTRRFGAPPRRPRRTTRSLSAEGPRPTPN